MGCADADSVPDADDTGCDRESGREEDGPGVGEGGDRSG